MASGASSLADRLIPDRVGPIDLPFDEAGAAARRYLDYRPPAPERVGVDVVGSAEAYALLGLDFQASADARAAAGVQIGGFVEHDGDTGIRWEIEANASAGADSVPLSIPGIIDPPTASAQFSQQVEVVFGHDGQPKQLVLERVTGVGDHGSMSRTTVDIVTPEQRADIQVIRDAYVSPTPANLARLEQIDPAHWAPHAHRVEATLDVGGEDYGAGAGAGAIPGLAEGSVDVKVEHQTIDYHYEDPRS